MCTCTQQSCWAAYTKQLDLSVEARASPKAHVCRRESAYSGIVCSQHGLAALQVCNAVARVLHPGATVEEETEEAAKLAKYLRNCAKTAIKNAIGGSRVETDRHLLRQLKTAKAVPDRSPSVTLISFALVAGVIAKVDAHLAEAVRQLQDAPVSGLGPLLPPAPTRPAPHRALPVGAQGTAAAASPSAMHPPGSSSAQQAAEHMPVMLPAAVQQVLPGGPLLLTLPAAQQPGLLPGLPCLAAAPHAALSASPDPPSEASNGSQQLCVRKAAGTASRVGCKSSGRQLRVTAGGPAAVVVAAPQLCGHARTSGGQRCVGLSVAEAAAALRKYTYPLGRPLPKTVKAWKLTAKQQTGRYGVKRGKGPVPTAMPVSREQRGYEQWSKEPVNLDRPPDIEACSHATFQGRLGTLHRFLGVCMREYKVPTECLSMELLSNPVGYWYGWVVLRLNRHSVVLTCLLPWKAERLMCRVSLSPPYAPSHRHP